jgi:hypothetical protein
MNGRFAPIAVVEINAIVLVFFFSPRSSGERWVAKHPGTFLCSLDDAFALAKHHNARNFELAPHAQLQALAA